MSEQVQKRVRSLPGKLLSEMGRDWLTGASGHEMQQVHLPNFTPNKTQQEWMSLNYFFHRKHNTCKHRVTYSNRCKVHRVKNVSSSHSSPPRQRTCFLHFRNTLCRVTRIPFCWYSCEKPIIHTFLYLSLSHQCHILETIFHIIHL